MSRIQAGRQFLQKLFGRGGKSGTGARPRPQRRRGDKGGLLAPGLAGIGGFGLGGLLGSMAGGRGQMGAAGDSGNLGLMSVAGAAGNNMVSADSATSILSDADSSDPVVRQLQDVERVLVAIKGDTGQLVSGIGFNNNQPQAANQESLRSMFGNQGNSEMGALGKGLASLGAGLLALNALPFLLKNLGEDDDELEAKRRTEPGSQERLNATAGDELIDLAATAGAKGLAKPLSKLGGEALEAIPTRPVTPKPKVDDAPRPRPTSVSPDTGKSPTILDSRGRPMERTPPTPPAADSAAKKARDAAADSLKKMGGAGVDALKRTPAAAAKLVAAVAKRGAQGAAKLLPGFGKGMNLWLGFSKLVDGDYVGAVGEAAGLIPFIGIPADFANTTRDIYKDVYDVFPEDEENVDLVAKRMGEIGMMLTKYIADLVGAGEEDDSAKQLEAVAARPEVTEKGKGTMARSRRMNQERRQKEWDEAFGDTHNADGSVMMSADAISPDGIAASPSMDSASPSIPMNNSAQVENESDAVTSGQREQNRAEIQQAMAGAVGASNNTLPYQPEVSVNVTSPKTSLPNNNAELLFIGNNVKHLV